MPTKTILMLLSNAYEPDPRVRQEALSLIGMGCRVCLLAWDRDRKASAVESMEGVEVVRVFLSSTHGRGATQIVFYAWLYIKMFWSGWRIRFDAVHCHDLDTLPLGFVLGLLKGKPIIYDAHESFPDMLEGSVPRAIQKCLSHLENFLIRRIDLLITVGEKLRRHFTARGARQTVIVGNWKRTAEYEQSEQQNWQTRRELGIPDGALTVVCITQLLKDRKIEELLQAVQDLPHVYLILGGKGVLEPVVRKVCAENPRVIYVGFVSGKQIANYTCAADVVYYGFDPANPNARFSAPNKLYEALAAGRSLITGDFGEIAEVVRRAQCGIVLSQYGVTEIREALATLDGVEVRNRMAQNAYAFGRAHFSWERGEEVLYDSYSQLLMGGLSRPSGATELRCVQAGGVGN
jgi:glycosyltransferase involved in cell wall biosynthesis